MIGNIALTAWGLLVLITYLETSLPHRGYKGLPQALDTLYNGVYMIIFITAVAFSFAWVWS